MRKCQYNQRIKEVFQLRCNRSVSLKFSSGSRGYLNVSGWLISMINSRLNVAQECGAKLCQ